MKMIRSAILGLMVAVASGVSAADAKYQSGKYDLDATHSKVGFEVPHLVISSVEGKFTKFDGKVDLNDKFEKSTVEANIDISSIDTGVAKRDDHLKGADFFDAAKYPKMTFKSTSIKGAPDAFQMKGDLTIHGTKRPVTFESKYLGTVVDGYGNQKVAFQAKTKISRKDFGLKWNNMVEAGPVIGDEVTIDLKIEGGRPAPAKK